MRAGPAVVRPTVGGGTGRPAGRGAGRAPRGGPGVPGGTGAPGGGTGPRGGAGRPTGGRGGTGRPAVDGGGTGRAGSAAAERSSGRVMGSSSDLGVDVAPAPGLSRLGRSHHRVVCGRVVRGRVAARAGVTAPDVPAAQTLTQMRPVLLALLGASLAEPLAVDVGLRRGGVPQMGTRAVVDRVGGDVTLADQPVTDGSPDRSHPRILPHPSPTRPTTALTTTNATRTHRHEPRRTVGSRTPYAGVDTEQVDPRSGDLTDMHHLQTWRRA